MSRANVIVALVAVLTAFAAPGVAQPDFSGEWTLTTATSNRVRGGGSGEQPVRQYVMDYSPFNCGRECRIVHKGSTLTVERAQFKDGATAPSPTVAIVFDGKSHTVVDSVTPNRTIESVARWQDGKLVITSVVGRMLMTQTVSLEQNQLVVVRLGLITDPDSKWTLRYTRKK